MEPMQSARAVWAEVTSDLRVLLGDNAHRSWTGRLAIHSADEDCVRLVGPSRFILSRIQTDYGHSIAELWEARDPRHVILGTAADFQKLVADSQALPAEARPEPEKGHLKLVGTPVISGAKPPMPSEPAPRPLDMPAALSPMSARNARTDKFTFDSFVVGPTNELAHAVCRRIANDAKVQYNPIVIHGPHGMGKTHLLHAVKNEIEAQGGVRRVLLINSEHFVSTFVKSVRGGDRDALDAFKAQLRGVDLLIIDDAHFIAEKNVSQEELLHTLVTLVEDGRQVLLAMDRHPHYIAKANDRLKSYMCAGLTCDIGPADYELRRRILDRLIEKKRAADSPALTMPKIARDHLAARINATPRELEGAFNQVVARSEFLGTPLTLENVQEALSDAKFSQGMRPTVDKIQRATAKEFGITMDDLLSKRRARVIARPRQVAMYLAKTLTTRSLPDIGRRFGGRDHTTVIHAVRRIEELRAQDQVLNAQIEAVIEALKA